MTMIYKCDFCSNTSDETYVRPVDVEIQKTQVDVASGKTEYISERYDLCMECLARVGLQALNNTTTVRRAEWLHDFWQDSSDRLS